MIDEKIRLQNYRPPKDPRQDRVFLAVQRRGSPAGDAGKVALLRRAGYPVATLTMPAHCELSRYMQFIHYAVFGLACLRDMNFVTQPSVELYKSITNQLHASAEKAGRDREDQSVGADAELFGASALARASDAVLRRRRGVRARRRRRRLKSTRPFCGDSRRRVKSNTRS